MNIQRLFGSQRALKTVEDFTEFEQRAAYFDGDPVIATKKGVNTLERGSQVHFMAEFQELLDFPAGAQAGPVRQARPREGDAGSRCAARSSSSARRSAPSCHPPPYYTDNLMHNLQAERFYKPEMINNGHGWSAPTGRSRRSRCAGSRIAAVPARRPAADAGRHGRVLQPGPGRQADTAGEGRPGGVPARTLVTNLLRA